jgi:GT2 family glycosyltransferase
LQRICTVVIATRNRPSNLEECLAALSRQQCAFPFGVLVVDNAPYNDLAAEIASRYQADYLIEPRVGLSYARNTGVAASEGEFIAFLDDDSIPDPHWLQNLLKPLEDPSVLAATGRVSVYYEENGERLPAPWHHYDAGPDGKNIDRNRDDWFSLANFQGSGVGANMAFRRQFFDKFKGFDERLGRGVGLQAFEESHAFFRILEAGYSVVYTPDATVQHPARDPEPGTYYSTTSYMALLCFEYPKYCFKVFRHIVRRLLQIEKSGVRLPKRSVRSWISGPFQYLAMRMRLGTWHSPDQRGNAVMPAKTTVKPTGKPSSVRQSS